MMRTSAREHVVLSLVVMSLLALGLLGCQSAVRSVTVQPESMEQESDSERAALVGDYQGLIYSHALHADLDCAACHAIVDGRPSRPDHDSCNLCHEIDMAEPDVDMCLLCHTLPVGMEPVLENLTQIRISKTPPASFDDVRYDHGPVADNEASCVWCHPKATSSEVLDASLLPDMALSVAGFERLGGVEADCAACHTRLSADVAPASHDADFMYSHGGHRDDIATGRCDYCHTLNDCHTCHATTPPRNHGEVAWDRLHGKQFHDVQRGQCLMCHKEDSCHQCHSTQMPADHTNFWRTRAHGQDAAMDRDRCTLCHREDSCISCHVGMAPKMTERNYHAPGSDCNSCHSPMSPVRPVRRHGPLPNESCLKCHRML